MANLHTPATYKRLKEDQPYMDKALQSFIRANYGANVDYDIRGDNIIIGDGSVMKLATIQNHAIDLQTHLENRPELNQVMQKRQKRVEEAEKVNNQITHTKSTEQMQADQARSFMERNARNAGHVPKTDRTKGSTSNLPSDNPQ